MRKAGHTAYTGMLVALVAFLGKKGKGRKDVDWYKEQLSKLDKKVLTSFLGAYQLLHISIGYDGTPYAKASTLGLQEAENVIEWIANRTAQA